MYISLQIEECICAAIVRVVGLTNGFVGAMSIICDSGVGRINFLVNNSDVNGRMQNYRDKYSSKEPLLRSSQLWI